VTPAERRSLDALIRRQVVIAVVAAAVVLASVVLVTWVVGQGEAEHAVLRPSADGRGVVPVSPAPESTRWATWAVVGALVAVTSVLVVLVHHTMRVVRFSWGRRA
jgi:hypothetical protein